MTIFSEAACLRGYGDERPARRLRYRASPLRPRAFVTGETPRNGAGLTADHDLAANRRLGPVVPCLLADQGEGIPAIAAAIVQPRGYRSAALSADVRRAQDGGGAGRVDRSLPGSGQRLRGADGTRLTLRRMAMSGRAMSNPGKGRERSTRMIPSPFDGALHSAIVVAGAGCLRG